MMKQYIKNLFKMWLITLSTNLLLLVVCVIFIKQIGIYYKPLVTGNTIFWCIYFLIENHKLYNKSKEKGE